MAKRKAPAGRKTKAAKKPASRTRKAARKAVAKKAVRKAVARKAVRKVVARKAASKVVARKAAPRRAAKKVAPKPAPAPAAPAVTAPAAPPAAPAPPAAQPPAAGGGEPGPNEDDEEPLVPGAPSSLVPDRRTGRVRAVASLEDELTAELSEDGGLRAGDLDVNLEQAYSSGDETPGGDNPTPDQDVVDLIGRSMGIEYDDAEELRGAEKVAERDRRRWELDPASAEDFKERKR